MKVTINSCARVKQLNALEEYYAMSIWLVNEIDAGLTDRLLLSTVSQRQSIIFVIAIFFIPLPPRGKNNTYRCLVLSATQSLSTTFNSTHHPTPSTLLW